MPNQKQTACYLRVSSRNGRQKTDSQKLALRRYCRSCGFKSVQWYEDRATGRNAKREQFQAMLDAVKAGKVARVVIWKLDRLTRGGLGDMLETISLILSHKTTIIVTSNNFVIDGSSPFNDFLIGLFGLLARLESDITGERIKAGLEAARAKGQKLGAKPKQRQREKIRKWKDQDVSVATMAKRLRRSRQAVYGMIERMQQESTPIRKKK